MKKKLLFLCTGNSCRSQMAEGWGKAIIGDDFDVYSAGIETHGLNPNALKVMAEAGVDISSQQSQHIDEFEKVNFDLVVTVCSHAHETCPWFPTNATVIHHGFDDPPKLAKDIQDETQKLEPYRRVRDEIKVFVETIPDLCRHLGE